MHNASSHRLVEHFFRHEYGRLVGALVQHFGPREIDLVEDAVQTALQQALKTWAHRGVPPEPAKWLHRTARNAAIDSLRRRKRGQEIVTEHLEGDLEADGVAREREDHWLADDRLRMLFYCADPNLPWDSQIAFALKVVAGFSIAEIGRALLVSESTIQKRITRAKEKLRNTYSLHRVDELVSVEERISAVQIIVYLLFNEGYFSYSDASSLRRDLCDEALRLAMLLEAQAGTHQPATCALIALMYFNYGRFNARLSRVDTPVLLEDQDRQQWDWEVFRKGMHWHLRSARGSSVSRFHIEAAIAWEHCRAPSLESTDWIRVRELYLALLTRLTNNSIRIGLAVAEYFVAGLDRALEALSTIPSDSLASELAQKDTLLGWMYRREGKFDSSRAYFDAALAHPLHEIQRKAILQLASMPEISSSKLRS